MQGIVKEARWATCSFDMTLLHSKQLPIAADWKQFSLLMWDWIMDAKSDLHLSHKDNVL